MPFSAEVICDSISEQGKRLTTMKLRYPKFIHGEFMTHRVFSRNASSSRAIPTKKLIAEVLDDDLRAGPVFWGKHQPGMQAVEELPDAEPFAKGWTISAKERAKRIWKSAALAAVNSAATLESLGAHKQIVNRLLEPFSHINVVVTATEWDNFFGLRLHPDAQPEMRHLATLMWEAYNNSGQLRLLPGEWHLPYIRQEDYAGAGWATINNASQLEGIDETNMLIRVSVARCARVSYESHETGKRSTVEEDLKLYDRLLTSGHWSPFEHQATPDNNIGNEVDGDIWANPEDWGNLVGWRQLRKTLPNEAKAPLPDGFQ